MTRLGVAVITYRRCARLERVVEAVEQHTSSPYRLVIAEDGGGDGTTTWARGRDLMVVTGGNHGVCWNKNRALYALMLLECDPILVLEDDVRPAVAGWERDWISATRRWDHLAYAHPKIQPEVIGGAGTAEDPYLNLKATAQCTAVSRRVLDRVGFLDSRFKGYGVGHAEWTTRIKRAGFGFREVRLDGGATGKANLFIRGGLEADDADSYRDNRQVVANQELFDRIKRDPIFRFPWSTGREEREFLAEQAEATAAVRSPAG